MNNLIKLIPIIQPSVKEMRKLHDTIESNVRALSLGINYQHFGPLLVSKEKKTINQEIIARENFKNSFDSKEESKNFTTSSLHTQARLKKCVFCKCEDHYSDQCRIITDTYTKREILKKGNLCFKCLNPETLRKTVEIK